MVLAQFRCGENNKKKISYLEAVPLSKGKLCLKLIVAQKQNIEINKNS